MFVSFSWDDGVEDQKVIDVFLKQDITSITFFPCIWPFCKNLKRLRMYDTFDVGCHTFGHPLFSKTEDHVVRTEICTSKAVLEDQLHRCINSFATPNGEYSGRIRDLVSPFGFEYIRTTGCPSPNGWMETNLWHDKTWVLHPSSDIDSRNLLKSYRYTSGNLPYMAIFGHSHTVNLQLLSDTLKMMKDDGHVFVTHSKLVRKMNQRLYI